MEAQAVVALVLGTVMVLFVPALVWSTVIAGLYQMVRDKVRALRPHRERYPFPTRAG